MLQVGRKLCIGTRERGDVKKGHNATSGIYFLFTFFGKCLYKGDSEGLNAFHV